jgi:hypothetical protein
MKTRSGVCLAFAIGLLIFATFAVAKSETEGDQSRGATFYAGFQGSSNAVGLVTRLDTAARYNFNKYFGVDLGIPFYFVNPSSTNTAATGNGFTAGLGNVYSDLRFSYPNPLVNYASVVTLTAPTGSKDKGLSTGRATVDWTNRLDRTFGRITPFVALGLANTITDTPFFLRPFTSLGFASHFEGGLEGKLNPWLGVGASAYEILPSGKQTIISRVVTSETSNAAQPTRPVTAVGNAAGQLLVRGNSQRSNSVFVTTTTTVGTASLAADHGFSTWLNFRPTAFMSLQVGYSRSVPYALNTFFFGTGFNLRALTRSFAH